MRHTKKTMRLVPTILISLLFVSAGQKVEFFGFYSYKDSAHTLEYDIKSDSTFTHIWSDGCQWVTVKGKWTIHLDTITLIGSRQKFTEDYVKLLKGIIDTKILICPDGLYTLDEKKKNKYIKDKKLVKLPDPQKGEICHFGNDTIVFDGNNFKHSPDSSKLNFCSCDSLKLSWGASMYNLDKQIVYCGYFKNYKLTYGLHYIYSADKKLEKIEKYYNGQVIGECKIK